MTPPPPPRGEAGLRDDARAILVAGVDAVDPGTLVAEALSGRIDAPGSQAARDAASAGRVVLLAGGKAAPAMARGARRVLGDRIAGGVVVGPPDGVDPGIPGVAFFRGGHPLPTEEGVAGARALAEAARESGARGDLVLFLLSGGGSAILSLPVEGVELDDLRATTRLLLESGAPIEELNAVRKHLEVLKGGGLARAAGGALLLALILSDVVGDPLHVIASGPVSPDPTTWADAVRVCRSRGVWNELPERARLHLDRGAAGEIPDTPTAADPTFERVATVIVGNARTAAEAAVAEARERGYEALLSGTDLEGEAREVGRELAATALRIRRSGEPVEPPAAVISAGETTVTVTGDGRGGRNQEVALGAVEPLDGARGVLVASMGTDGVDGPTDAAGALATGSTAARARAAGLDPAGHLERNDAYPVFEALDDLIVTGPTGTNVMDLQVVLVAGPGRD